MWDAVRKFLRQDEAPEERPAPGEPAPGQAAPGPGDSTAAPPSDATSGDAAQLQQEAPPIERPAPQPERQTVEVSPPSHAPQGLAAEETTPTIDETATPAADEAALPSEEPAPSTIAPSGLPTTASLPDAAPAGGSAQGSATMPATSELAADVAPASASMPAQETAAASAEAPVEGEGAASVAPEPPISVGATADETLPSTADELAPADAAATPPEGMEGAAGIAMPEAAAAPMPGAGAAPIPAGVAPPATDAATGADATVSDNTVAAEPAPEAEPAQDGAAVTAEAEAIDEAVTPAAAEPAEQTEIPESTAPAAPAPLVALAAGTMVGERYKIAGLIEGAEQGDDMLTYRASDARSYEHCWSCGSAENAAATRFCQNCGAPVQDHPVTLIERREASGDPGEVEHDGAYFHVEPERRRFGAEGIGVEAGAYSAEGPHHPNEDSYWYVTRTLCANSGRQSLAVAVFADGMGGYAPGSGLISSRIAATAGSHIFSAVEARNAAEALDEDEAALIVRAAITAANTMVTEEIARTGEMGATLVVALVYGETAYLANIGDSRAYYVDPRGRATAITRDQSLVAQEVAQGHLAESDVYTAIGNNIILHAVGEESVEDAADWYTQPLEPGSYLLLCSDGYWKTLRGEVMPRGTLDGSATLGEAARRMVDNALTQGSDDNTTVVLIAIS